MKIRVFLDKGEGGLKHPLEVVGTYLLNKKQHNSSCIWKRDRIKDDELRIWVREKKRKR